MRLRAALTAALAFAAAVLWQSTPVCADQRELPRMVLKAGFTSGMFPDVDQRDAQVAMQLWTREMVRGMGIDAEARMIIYPRTEDLLAAVKKGELTVVSLPAVDYLQIRSEAPMTPAIVSSNNTGRARQFILLTRRDSGIRTVKDLRGKSLLLPSRNRNYADISGSTSSCSGMV